MILFEFYLNVPGFRRGKLLGRMDGPSLTAIRLGFCGITVLGVEANKLLREALAGLMRDPDWTIKNLPEIRKYKEEAFLAAMESSKSLSEEYKNLYYEAEEKLQDAQIENRNLRDAIESIYEFGVKEKGGDP